jgi:hypothetical protein
LTVKLVIGSLRDGYDQDFYSRGRAAAAFVDGSGFIYKRLATKVAQTTADISSKIFQF